MQLVGTAEAYAIVRRRRYRRAVQIELRTWRFAGGPRNRMQIGGFFRPATRSTEADRCDRTVYNAFQHRRYTLTCVDAPCDAVAKSLHFTDPQPIK